MSHFQHPLFDAPPTLGTARASDPWTSKAAAASIDPSPDMRRVLLAIDASGGEGTVDDCCALMSDRDRGCVSRRITDCVTAGLLVDTGRTEVGSRGRHVTIWRLT